MISCRGLKRFLLVSVAVCSVCVPGVSRSDVRSLTGVVTDRQEICYKVESFRVSGGPGEFADIRGT